MKKMMMMLVLGAAILAAGCGKKEVSETITVENTEEVLAEQENKADEDVQEEAAGEDSGALSEGYLDSVKEKADAIRYSLENDVLTQSEMNEKSMELYELWDEALNFLWGEIKARMSEDEFAKLLEEQRAWITEKEQAVLEAGEEYEGGSMHSLVVNMKAAELTEERVYEFCDLLK